MVTINELQPGQAIIYRQQPHLILRREHTVMGRGGGFVRARLKNLLSGATVETTFKGGDRVDEADLARSQAHYLYDEGDEAVFMDLATFDQFRLSRETLPESAKFMAAGATVDVLSYHQRPITVTVPIKVELRVSYTEPGFKGNTTATPLKPATLETGATVQVPLFVAIGDVIRLDTRDGRYLERVSK